MGAEDSLKKFLLCAGCLALLKLTETWLLTPRLDKVAQEGVVLKEPRVYHPRCDACRASALLLDSMLREADSLLGPGQGELEREEVQQIVDRVCHTDSFSAVQLVMWEGAHRLALPYLDTWHMRDSPSHQGKGMNWAGRLKDHCSYLAGSQRMPPEELYDLWLRAGHRDTKEWISFLCEGEGVFADCLEDHPLHVWPGSEGPSSSSGGPGGAAQASAPLQFTENL